MQLQRCACTDAYLALVRWTSILRREFTRAIPGETTTIPGLKERCCNDAHRHWNIGLIGRLREYPASSAWPGGDCRGQTGNYASAAGALSFV
jgi:hypothetical protein